METSRKKQLVVIVTAHEWTTLQFILLKALGLSQGNRQATKALNAAIDMLVRIGTAREQVSRAKDLR